MSSGAGPGLSTKVARGVAWAAGAQAIIAIADIVSVMLVMALWVPVADWGIAALAFPFYTMLDTAADLGVTSSLIQRDDHTPERVSTVFWFNMLISSGLFLVLLVLGPLYGHIVDHPIVGWLLVAYGGKLVFQNVYAIPFALLRKELRFNEIAIARVLAHLAESVARCVFAWLGFTIWCFTLAALTRAFVFGVIMQIRHPFLPRFLFRPREVTQYIKFGLRTAASQVLYQLYTNLDYPIVGYYFGAWANGIYAGAYFFVLEPVKTIANVVIDVAFPTFARLRDDPPMLVDQFIKFTRLNLIAVLPFIVLIALVLPEFLRVFYVGDKWTLNDVPYVVNAAHILCLVGLLRALGFLGPPLLDGIGHPERTLRYMVIATFVVPGMFVVAANVLGDRINFLSVAVGWAVGYPIAFAALCYLVVKAIDLPIGQYLRAAWGIVGCCLGGYVAGLVVRHLLAHESDKMRMVIVAATSFVVTGFLLAFWQKITPRSIGRSLKG
ncbi:MAG TPA: oligosaccharide flippase family protein [Kofleriaceae bacterium]|nr:oligosaccharide flippase family protein [Kofleriaceae bacterium]